MENTEKPTKSITDTMDEARSEFTKRNGRLLTEEEAIKLTAEIRKNLKREGNFLSLIHI